MAVNKLDISMMEDVGTSASQLVQRDGSGNLPAIDGSQLTNVDPGFTQSTSDPVITTNPSGGVGSVWFNKTSGEAYICTDATAGSNVWTNVGAGSGNIQLTFQGESFGYASGGRHPSATNNIQKYSFSSDANSTDIANLVTSMFAGTGIGSKTYSYLCGSATSPGTYLEKHQFATTNNSTTVGTLMNDAREAGGVSGNDGYGYVVAGDEPHDNIIQRFSFSSDGNASDVGDLTRATNAHASASDWTASYGYAAAGVAGSPNGIDRFAFASSVTSSDVGDVVNHVSASGDHSSITHGYLVGGYVGGLTDDIQKYAFAASGNASDVGNLIANVYGCSGTSSTTHGYSAGGNFSTGSNFTDRIEKYSHSSDGNSTDVANLIDSRTYTAGTHI